MLGIRDTSVSCEFPASVFPGGPPGAGLMRGCPGCGLSEPNLLHEPDQVVEQPFLDNLSLVVPCG